jgi:hypothetical protein
MRKTFIAALLCAGMLTGMAPVAEASVVNTEVHNDDTTKDKAKRRRASKKDKAESCTAEMKESKGCCAKKAETKASDKPADAATQE